MKKTFLLLALALLSINTFGQMVLEYNISTPNTEIKLPLYGTVNVTINWGDSSAIETVNVAGDKSHIYNSVGTKKVTITGTLTQFGSFFVIHGSLLKNVLSWDGLGLNSLNYAFNGATDLISVPSSLPTSVTDLSGVFYNATSFNQPIGTWNTQNVTDMSFMFYYALAFNQPIGIWNTQNVTNMNSMFYNTGFDQPIGTWNTQNVTDMERMFNFAYHFNQPIGNWNTANVITMKEMFYNAYSFNQPIGNWNTANVVVMEDMFYSATSFNQPIGNWNTANLTDMNSMFENATSFNQPIGTWNTAKVNYMFDMFRGATSFNQPLGTWDITSVFFLNEMFSGSNLCTANYDNILNGWAAQKVKSWVPFSGGASKYSAAASAARATLVGKGWEITDGGQGLSGNCDVTELEDQTYIDTTPAVYPNPATNEVYSTNFAQLYDVTGKLVAEGQGKIDVSPLPRGMYILKAENRITKLVLR